VSVRDAVIAEGTVRAADNDMSVDALF